MNNNTIKVELIKKFINAFYEESKTVDNNQLFGSVETLENLWHYCDNFYYIIYDLDEIKDRISSSTYAVEKGYGTANFNHFLVRNFDESPYLLLCDLRRRYEVWRDGKIAEYKLREKQLRETDDNYKIEEVKKLIDKFFYGIKGRGSMYGSLDGVFSLLRFLDKLYFMVEGVESMEKELEWQAFAKTKGLVDRAAITDFILELRRIDLDGTLYSVLDSLREEYIWWRNKKIEEMNTK